MLERFKRTIRRMVVKKDESKERDRGARAPENPPPGPPRPDEARPGGDEASGDFAVPVTRKERRHDGWGPIRPRRPGEDTDIGRDMIPDITDPGPDLGGENRR